MYLKELPNLTLNLFINDKSMGLKIAMNRLSPHSTYMYNHLEKRRNQKNYLTEMTQWYYDIS